ncbi:MAG TPA: hypothetical protein VE988_12770 [Gemmataceae bacterium]|nr:hypothetical protein [Gemmataceae bacterium]
MLELAEILSELVAQIGSTALLARCRGMWRGRNRRLIGHFSDSGRLLKNALQFRRIHRFQQMQVDANLVRALAHVSCSVSGLGDEQRRFVRPTLANLGRNLEAIHVRQAQVEQDDIEDVMFDQIKG